MQTSRIEIVNYSPLWPKLFEREAHILEQSIGNYLVSLHHIGSTSIKHMPAKPVVDILVETKELDEVFLIEEQLMLLGYENLRRSVIPYRSFFTRKEVPEICYHLHIYEVGDPQVARHIRFRDYMRQHSSEASLYAELKKKLARQFGDNRYAYVLGKDKFVQAIDAKGKSEIPFKSLPQQRGKPASAWTEKKILQSMKANLVNNMTYFEQYLESSEFIRTPKYVLVNSGLPDGTYNYILDTNFSSEETDHIIKTIVTHFEKLQLPFSWWLTPGDKPKDLEFALLNAGFEDSGDAVGMWLNLDDWQPEPSSAKLTFKAVKDEQGFIDFAKVLDNEEKASQRFFKLINKIYNQEDPMEYYVGYVDGKPVTRGEIDFYAQVAGIYFIATAEDERKKGYAHEMMRFLLKRAKELGYHIVVLQPSQESISLYKNLGFSPCGSFKEFRF